MLALPEGHLKSKEIASAFLPLSFAAHKISICAIKIDLFSLSLLDFQSRPIKLYKSLLQIGAMKPSLPFLYLASFLLPYSQPQSINEDQNQPGHTSTPCGGGIVGNGVCPDGTCCSIYGWCGATSEYCSGSNNKNNIELLVEQFSELSTQVETLIEFRQQRINMWIEKLDILFQERFSDTQTNKVQEVIEELKAVERRLQEVGINLDRVRARNNKYQQLASKPSKEVFTNDTPIDTDLTHSNKCQFFVDKSNKDCLSNDACVVDNYSDEVFL